MSPSAPVLWAQQPGSVPADLLAGIPRVRPRMLVFTGGPGWTGSASSLSEQLESLGQAADRITRAVLGSNYSA